MNLAQALAIATLAHEGQTDKAGRPYIGHIQRVVSYLDAEATDDERIVAALHDVVEDTELTLDDLRRAGLAEHLVAAVDAVTKRKGESNVAYYARVRANPIALRVKQADLKDNTDPARRAALTDRDLAARLDRKYAIALAELGLDAPWA